MPGPGGLRGRRLNLGEVAFLASPTPRTEPYLASSAKSRTAMLSLILAFHVLAVAAVISIGKVVIETLRPPMQVTLVPEPPRPSPEIPVHAVPLPQFRQPQVVIPEPPRVETLAAIEVIPKPAPPPPAPVVTTAPAKVPAPVSFTPPRHDLAYLENPAPSYPVFAKRAREQGKVWLRVQVDTSGRVAGIEIEKSSGYERLDTAAIAAVRRWKFAPAQSGDQPVAGVALVPINFALEG